MKKKLFNFNIYKNSKILLALLIIFSALIFFLFQALNNYNDTVVDEYIQAFGNESQNEALFSLGKGDTSSYLKEVISVNKELLSRGVSDENGITKYYLTNEMNFDTYLLDNSIQAQNLLMGDYNQLQDVNGATTMYYMFKWVLPLILPFIILFIILRSIYSEKRSLDFLLLLPVNKDTIVKSKLFSSIFISSLIAVILSAVAFSVGCLLGGIGDLNYPIALNSMHLNSGYHNSNLPLYVFLLLGSVGIFVKISLYSAIGLFIGYAINNKWIGYLMIMILGLAPICYFMFLNEPLYANVATGLIPFVYDSVYSIITYGYSKWMILGYYGLAIIIFVSSIRQSVIMAKE